jgi:hypothetical protein
MSVSTSPKKSCPINEYIADRGGWGYPASDTTWVGGGGGSSCSRCWRGLGPYRVLVGQVPNEFLGCSRLVDISAGCLSSPYF